MAFGLTGPSFSVGGGMHAALEALAVGAVLVEGGDADRIVVVAVDDIGSTATALGGAALRSGAVAVLVSGASRGPVLGSARSSSDAGTRPMGPWRRAISRCTLFSHPRSRGS